MAEVDERNNELKSKQICRCCMNQYVSLSNIYSRENRLKSTVPLPLQIMACVSIEVSYYIFFHYNFLETAGLTAGVAKKKKSIQPVS